MAIRLAAYSFAIPGIQLKIFAGEDWTQELNKVGFTGWHQKIKAVK
ncbi:MAG: hypothetical protein WBB28_24020 [Crinalium sp.]